MKTHTSRWTKERPATWLLKARVQDGGVVLGRIERRGADVYDWTAGLSTGRSSGFYAAQRAVRKALAAGEGVGDG